MFCSSKMSGWAEVTLSKYLGLSTTSRGPSPMSQGTDGWKGKMNKGALRSWYPHSERILVFEHGAYGHPEAYRRSPARRVSPCLPKKGRVHCARLATDRIGAYGKVNHGGAVANWETRRMYPGHDEYGRIWKSSKARAGWGR